MLPLNPRIPAGPLAKKWRSYESQVKHLDAATRQRYKIIVVGAGLAGSSAAVTLAQMGYSVKMFCLEDSMNRASSLAAHGDKGMSKNQVSSSADIEKIFQAMITSGDFRAREADVYRLAELQDFVYEHCGRMGVALESSLLSTDFHSREEPGAIFSSSRESIGQRLLYRLYWSLLYEAMQGRVEIRPWTEMMDLVLVDNEARGIVARYLPTGRVEPHFADAVVLASGGYANIYWASTNGRLNNASAIWRAHKRGAFFANPGLVQFYPLCLAPRGDFAAKRVFLDEILRQDARVWTPRRNDEGRYPSKIPEAERDYFLERKFPGSGDHCANEYAAHTIRQICETPSLHEMVQPVVYLDFSDGIKRLGLDGFRRRYGNVLSQYEKMLPLDPYLEPVSVAPAAHGTLGGLWVNYQLMTTIPGLFAIGEANCTVQGANRIHNYAMLQALTDGFFILPVTISDYLAHNLPILADISHLPQFQQAVTGVEQTVQRLLAINGSRQAGDFHKQLGRILWQYCGTMRSKQGLVEALDQVQELHAEFWQNVGIPGSEYGLNAALEHALQTADYFELAQVMIRDALARRESCGVHLREEYLAPNGDKIRDDWNFSHIAVWEYAGREHEPVMHKEQLTFNGVQPH